MESQSDYSTPPNSRATSPYHVFAFAIPTTPQPPRSADTSGPDLELDSGLNETSTAGTLSTPYSSLIATPDSATRPSTTYPRHERQTPLSPASQGSSLALRTVSSRPPFAFFPPPEPYHHDLTNPSTPVPQSSLSKAEELVPGDGEQEEKSICLVDTNVPPLPDSPSIQLPDIVGDDDSPYPEVRASVANTDDPDMPTLTFRTWLIGITLLSLRASLNIFFYLRWPSPRISRALVTIIAYPFGRALDRLLPIRSWTIPRALPIIGGLSFSLNPGPFNIKEHTLISMMSSIGGEPIYGFPLIISAETDYNTPISTGFAFLFLLGSQIATLSFAAFGRSLFIYPASVIWPNTLIVSALLNTLHAEEESRKGQMTRYRFFVIWVVVAFFYYFLPGYLFTALSSFSWACWISPNDVVLNQLFGTVTGLGMGLLTFDWSQISFIGSPLILPWWASVNAFLGFVTFFWILAPILYYNDVWKMGHLPITGYSAYDRFGLSYDVHRILTPDMQLNVTAYQEYSPVYLPVTFALTYFNGFILVTSVIVHAILYEGHAVLAVLRRRKVEDDDIHATLMRRYREVSNYYYVGIFVVGFALLIGAFKVQDLGVPVWSLFLATLLAFIYFIPCTYIYARSGLQIPINLIAELIPGALLPGRPFANMAFKICAANGLSQPMLFLENLKQGHYLKIPPYASFAVQLIAVFISVCVQIVVKNAVFASVPDVCDPNQPQKLVCPSNKTFFTASIVWGLIGTSRQFGKGSLYPLHVYGLVIGALLPIPLWLWQRKYPKSILRHFNLAVFLDGPTYAPPATGVNFTSFFIVAFLFQYLLRVRRFRLWAKFNYVLACALEAGTGVAVIVIFLAFQLPNHGRISLDWWGNTVWANTADAVGVPYLPTDPDKGF